MSPTPPPKPLNDRALGWLRFIWDKATTEDDWTDQGEPHPWWDRYSEPPMCAFPRFDLSEMSYVLPLMLTATPAWREGYLRILDELLRRYTTFWGAIDWNTLIGPDPNADRYPPDWLITAPEHLRGRYNLPGWTGNGIEPWGLQPDPVGCDGNLFYRGWLNLALGLRQHLSGQPVTAPFEVIGYQNRPFTWTHERIARFLSTQMAARPQGPHCENTKIWPFCMSAAGLGLRLYDIHNATTLNDAFLEWVAFAKRHYMGRDRRGRLSWVALYYDPIQATALVLPGPVSAYAAITLLHYLYPQDPELSIELYDMAVRMLGWSNPYVPVLQLADDPQMLSNALWMARELGDTVTERRLREIVETTWRPTFFGDEKTRFAFWVQPEEPWPRGQINATLMMTEAAPPGAWSQVFTAARPDIYTQPTLTGVDYPRLGIKLAYNDAERNTLQVNTFAATPSQRGEPTSVTVDNLPAAAAVSVRVDGRLDTRWTTIAPGTIRIDCDINDHQLEITYGSAVTNPERTPL